MLRVNVGLSRKVSRDYQSPGYSVNLDGEVVAPLENPQAILNAIDQLYRLAENALSREIARDQGDQPGDRRDDQQHPHNGSDNGRGKPAAPEQAPTQERNGTNRSQSGQGDAATNKQVQYLLSLGKRQGLSKAQLEARIEEVVGKRLTVYQLSKKEAGRVIDALTQEAPADEPR